MNVLLAASSTPPTAPRALRSSRPSGLRVPPCAAPGPLSRAGRKGAAPGAAQAPGRAVVAMALGDGEASDSAAEEQLLADIARMRAKEGIPEGADVRAASRTQEEGGLKQTIEKVRPSLGQLGRSIAPERFHWVVPTRERACLGVDSGATRAAFAGRGLPERLKNWRSVPRLRPISTGRAAPPPGADRRLFFSSALAS